ncbi:MAG: CCA tRNA nucleotidyltransferase [Candidatus Verstraetearchaeota archaeon]|nr:CCA tRNA nucleotidyltransferase [Candidatus Verstraetearchaeota archaeon]
MGNEGRIACIKSEALRRIRPSGRELETVRAAVEIVRERILEAAKEKGADVRVEVEGSIAKGTWISADRDVDIFIIFPRGTNKETVATLGMELAKAGAGGKWKTGYAEHPYVETEFGGCRFDIVPGVELVPGGRPMTAVDRTPLHTAYIKSKLNEEGKDEVRVLKQFMKGIGVYGAELRVGGFSGYLCELLIVRYSRFELVLDAAARWGERVAIDIEGHYKGEREVLEVFNSPLVIVDPVDKGRNAAAAVTRRALSTFVSAARHFLRSPNEKFLFPKVGVKSVSELVRLVEGRGSVPIGVLTTCPSIPSDVLWGEILHSLSKMTGLLKEKGFKVLDSGAWSDEEDEIVFLIELEEAILPGAEIRAGPSVIFPEDERRFLEKHLRDERTIAGPFIIGDRWNVLRRRGKTDAAKVLSEHLTKMRLSPDVAKEIRHGFRILEARALVEYAEKDPDLRHELWKFLRKRPLWLEGER